MNGLSLIRHLNDEAAREANEAMLVGDMFREINEEIAADEAQEANEDPGTIRERLAVIQENTDPVVIELILTMASECTELGLAALILNVLQVDDDEALANEMMREILDKDLASAGHVLAHMQDLTSD